MGAVTRERRVLTQNAAYTGKRPLVALQKVMNKEVKIKLKNTLEYKGVLLNVDSYMNVFLDEAFEYREDGNISEKLGRIVIRGNNILYVILGEELVV